MVLDEVQAAVDEVFVAANTNTGLAALLLPEGSTTAHRARVGLHLCLESAGGLRDLLAGLDELGIYLAGHGDDATGAVLLELSDRIREDVAE
jgi:hypothetical protein